MTMHQQQPQISVDDAFRILDQATSGIQTTRQGHHMMGLALSTLASRINMLEAQVAPPAKSAAEA